jgi:hypothetical protein
MNVERADSGMYPVVAFDISSTEHLGSARLISYIYKTESYVKEILFFWYF